MRATPYSVHRGNTPLPGCARRGRAPSRRPAPLSASKTNDHLLKSKKPRTHKGARGRKYAYAHQIRGSTPVYHLKRLNVPTPYAAHLGLTASARECTSPGASLRQLSAGGRRSLSVAFRVTRSVTAFFYMPYSNTAVRKTQAIRLQYFMRRRGTRDCKRACAKKRRAQSPGAGAFPSFFTVCFFPPGAYSSAPQHTWNCQMSST